MSNTHHAKFENYHIIFLGVISDYTSVAFNLSSSLYTPKGKAQTLVKANRKACFLYPTVKSPNALLSFPNVSVQPSLILLGLVQINFLYEVRLDLIYFEILNALKQKILFCIDQKF